MKKLLFLSVVMMLMVGSSIFATDTRVMTMGDNNVVMLDEANIWVFPSRTLEYPNLAIGEFGIEDEDFNQLGIHWKFGTDNPWVLGTYFTEMEEVYPGQSYGFFLNPFDNSLPDNRRIDLFYGNSISDMNFGARLSYLQSGTETDATGDQSKESFGFYDLALGLTPPDGKWDVAVNVGMGSWTDENADGDKETEPDGFNNFSAIGRYFYMADPNYTFIPHVGFAYAKIGFKDYVDVADANDDVVGKYTVTGFDLGCGINYTPATNVLAVADFGILYEKYAGEITEAGTTVMDASEKYFSIPYFKIGMDADVFKWLDVRLGATSYWVSGSYEDELADYKQKAKYAENDTYLGFGFHWNRLHVDAYTNPQLFLDGFNFISGEENEMNARLSVVYEMM